MKVYEQDNTVIIEDIKDFDPKHIFECGQCFRWIKEEDESYTSTYVDEEGEDTDMSYYDYQDEYGKPVTQYDGYLIKFRIFVLNE